MTADRSSMAARQAVKLSELILRLEAQVATLKKKLLLAQQEALQEKEALAAEERKQGYIMGCISRTVTP